MKKITALLVCLLLITASFSVFEVARGNGGARHGWGRIVEDECVGIIATGTVCKNGMSILHKNRHWVTDNQQVRFFQGINYTYFGIGDKYAQTMCRMGQNEKGLVVANFNCYEAIENVTGHSDGSSGSEDNDLHNTLGQFSTVKDAARYLAHHGYFFGQYLIISAEPGVGAIVAIDNSEPRNTNICWVNNSYAAVANAWYCDGKHDRDGTDIRAKEILDDIVNNGTSSDGDNLLNWKDVAQRIAKDTSDKEDGEGEFSYEGEISSPMSCSAMVSVAGNASFGDSIHMSWLNFGRTTQIGIFLPIYAGNLHSEEDIPPSFTEANGGNGIAPYVKPKFRYASVGVGAVTKKYYCDKVRTVLRHANEYENITFNGFENLLNTIMSSADEGEVRETLAAFVNETLPISLNNYITMPDNMPWGTPLLLKFVKELLERFFTHLLTPVSSQYMASVS